MVRKQTHVVSGPRKRPSGAFPFLKLPAELRLDIYDLVYGNSAEIKVVWDTPSGTNQFAAVKLLASQMIGRGHCAGFLEFDRMQVYAEIGLLLFKNRTFYFMSKDDSFSESNLIGFLRGLGEYRRLIQNMVIRWSFCEGVANLRSGCKGLRTLVVDIAPCVTKAYVRVWTFSQAPGVGELCRVAFGDDFTLRFPNPRKVSTYQERPTSFQNDVKSARKAAAEKRNAAKAAVSALTASETPAQMEVELMDIDIDRVVQRTRIKGRVVIRWIVDS